MMATIGRIRFSGRAMAAVRPDRDQQREGRGAQRTLRERVQGQTPDERPDQPAVESDGDGPDDRQDERQVRLGIAHPQVLGDGRFNDGGHRRCDRGDEQGHGRSDPRRARFAPRSRVTSDDRWQR